MQIKPRKLYRFSPHSRPIFIIGGSENIERGVVPDIRGIVLSRLCDR